MKKYNNMRKNVEKKRRQCVKNMTHTIINTRRVGSDLKTIKDINEKYGDIITQLHKESWTPHLDLEQWKKDGWDALCLKCGDGGKLLCCDGCTGVIHPKCAGLEKMLDYNEPFLCTDCVYKHNLSCKISINNESSKMDLEKELKCYSDLSQESRRLNEDILTTDYYRNLMESDDSLTWRATRKLD
tara:strand:- start:5100 stop:5654 length:555 start_codon:yes stop_codon:yes gene_type:complete